MDYEEKLYLVIGIGAFLLLLIVVIFDPNAGIRIDFSDFFDLKN